MSCSAAAAASAAADDDDDNVILVINSLNILSNMNHAIKRGVHTFSKYLGATTKLQATER